MKGLASKLSVGVLAVVLGACASVHKVDMPPTAVPSEEISRLDADINQGFDAQYDVLAPKEFEKAQRYVGEAKEDMSKGRKQSVILDDVGYARAYLEKAKEHADARQTRFQGLLEARKIALNAGAKNYPVPRERIAKLDDRFRKVSDDSDLSTDKFNSLQNAYFDIELNAIQATQLDKAQATVTGARRDGADNNTPRALKQAELDLTNAYNVVAANRHSPENYKEAVDKANASAQFLMEVLTVSKRPDKDLAENVATEMVLQNRKLAGLQGQLSQTEAEAQELSQQVNQQRAQLSEAEAAQQLAKALNDARKEFGKDEAEVYQQGDKLLIRLKSMAFPVGKADLPQRSLNVLAKVKGIAEELNPQQVVIEGHTDATGNAAINQKVSQERAQIVAQYLETNGVDSDKIQAVGQGYQRPIASNKTKAGRAKNRRVDVIITPSKTATMQGHKM